MPPTLLASFDQRPRIVELDSGVLIGYFVDYENGRPRVGAFISTDNGATWRGPETVLELPRDEGGWGGVEALVDDRRCVHLFLLNDRGSGVFEDPSGEESKRKKFRPGERYLDIWHVRSEPGGQCWRAPQCVWQGYTGALNSVVQLRSGRILLPFSCQADRAWGNRGADLDAFTFWGYFDSTLIYSDDSGDTWRQTPDRIKVPVPDISYAYGAVEPVVLELKDGRVWMLIRTQMGRLYECFSPDGLTWSRPRYTRFLSSDSPAGIARLADGRIVLLWNCCLRFPYAYGGRHVLHAAITEDEGRTWRGWREVARDPFNDQPPPPSGDHGTAYPYPLATADGKLIFTTGQGKGRIAIARLDPEWLHETTFTDDFTGGLGDWHTFGTAGVALAPHPDKPGRHVLSIRKTRADASAAAVRNFPAGRGGTLKLRLFLYEGFGGAAILLTDHFSVPFDDEDEINAVFGLWLGRDRVQLATGAWHDVEMRWDCGERLCRVTIDGREYVLCPQAKDTECVCYLRIRSTAEETDTAGLLVESVEVKVFPW